LRGLRCRPVWSSVAVVCSLTLGMAAASASAAALPPNLVALEQKMQALHVNSERGTLVEVLTGGSLGGESILGLSSIKRSRHRRDRKETVVHLTTHPKQSIPFLTADFEVSDSPKLAVIRGNLLGAFSLQERVIGEQVYARSSLLGLIDGGKPWVSTSAAERAQEQEHSGEKGGEKEGGEEGGSSITESAGAEYGKLIDLLAHAGSVLEIGPREVDGQRTIEFEAKLDSEQLLDASSTSKLSEAKKKRLGRSTLRLDLFLADDGLPVRTRMQTQIGKAEITVVEDVLATEVSVSVQPPPASETITAAELKKHEEKSPEVHLSKRERKEIRHFENCLQRHRPKGHRPLTKRERKQILRECPLPK
jgi:hypothetical protein